MMTEFPSHPAGYLYLAGMLQAKYVDLDDRFDEQRYDSLLAAAEKYAAPMIARKGTEAFGYYYTGTAEAFRSFTRSELGNIPSGIYYGLAAGRSLEKCLAADPSFTEAKNILGAYYYWRSKMAWIPFVPDKSEEGIAMIRESYSHPYEKHLASHNLMVIFTEEERFAEAEKVGIDMLKEYPQNRRFLVNMVLLYEQWGKKKELNEYSARLLAAVLRAPVINRYSEASCRLRLAAFAADHGDRDAARTHVRAILGLRPYIGKTKHDLRKKIDAAEKLLTTLNGE